MPWQRKKLKGNKVYARVNEHGDLVANRGRVEIRYKLEDPRAYHAAAANLEKLPEETTVSFAESAQLSPDPERPPYYGTRRPIVIYTDGSCRGNPGPAGAGIVMTCGDHRKEHAEFLGRGTNNIAELAAIKKALELVKDPLRTVILYTDSQYSLGVLQQGWKAKANRDLIADTRQLMRRFPDLRLTKVAGHAGVEENERCDELAREVVEAHAPRSARVKSPQGSGTSTDQHELGESEVELARVMEDGDRDQAPAREIPSDR